MRLCWDTDPEQRPNFSQLAQQFGDLVESSASQVGDVLHILHHANLKVAMNTT